MKVKIYTDGGARWNPGHAGIGVAIFLADDDTILESRYKYIGICTNNQAEYQGVYYGIQRAIELGATGIEVYMDSLLVVRQLEGKFKVKHLELREWYLRIQEMSANLSGAISYTYIPRECNAHADRLANKAMDSIKR